MLSFLWGVPVTPREFNNRRPNFFIEVISTHPAIVPCLSEIRDLSVDLSPSSVIDTLLKDLNSDLLAMRLDTVGGLAYPQKPHHCKSSFD